ncbi:unnamed protein product [Triticum turgidum subsp. durum]|uniref:Uncharacterized protein n=1 Tax=Triticum turgidum subsp. durum TaxID=4567 RepID=A0A9R0XNW7_TRITD|nr:unnamed protein product [Triticum turgidum subsp. durum]
MGSEMVAGPAAGDEEACMYAMQLAGASILPMTLKGAIELGMLEVLVSAGGEMLSPSEVIARLPSKAANPDAPAMVDRMLRLLASYNVVLCEVDEGEDGLFARRYGPAPVCKWLTPNEDVKLNCEVSYLTSVDVNMWYHLKDAVLDGGLPFQRAYGMTLFEYNSTNIHVNRMFNEAMKNHSTIITKKLLEFYMGFDSVGTLVDVAGGVGATIHTIISKYPHIKGVNFDLPHVISDAPSFPGVEHVGGDMFEKVPSGDAILLKWILHDWTDKHCTTLLRNCFDALPAHGKVIIVEGILPVKPDSTSRGQLMFLDDMIMLMHTPGGKERQQREFDELARGVGFNSVKTTHIYGNAWVIEFMK